MLTVQQGGRSVNGLMAVMHGYLVQVHPENGRRVGRCFFEGSAEAGRILKAKPIADFLNASGRFDSVRSLSKDQG